MQKAIETAVNVERFGMSGLFSTCWPLMEKDKRFAKHIPALRRLLGDLFSPTACAVLRNVFLIELVVVPGVTTTKFRVRWDGRLDGDPRWCGFEECLGIAKDLLGTLEESWLAKRSNMKLLELFREWGLLPYEVPLDYAERPEPDDETRIHRQGNLGWVATPTMLRTLELRRFLLDNSTSPDRAFFRQVLDDKIKVKTYLTDRAQTGEYKTNREKRWECHPHSVQFANRRTCMEIEYRLITQLCAFEGFPESSRKKLQEQGILPASLPVFRCPITLEPLSFEAFRAALTNPSHGRSDFQVGHLNPLKLDASADEAAGHTADNISWISANGNRIQGHLSLAEVRKMLRKIAQNYEETGWS